MSLTVPALLTPSAGAPFERGTVERRELGEHDVLIDIAYAGICHSDIHQARAEWGKAIFPMVPGHEIAGVVSAVGSRSRSTLRNASRIVLIVEPASPCYPNVALPRVHVPPLKRGCW